MHYNDLIISRQSCRNYDASRRVSEGDLIDICREALLSPSACNSQPWKLVLVQSPDAVTAALPAFHAPFMKDVHSFVVVCETEAVLKDFVIQKLKNSRYFTEMDLGILTAHLVLAAADKGIGSCIVGMFDENALSQALDLPQGTRPRLVVALGYSKEGDPIRPKQRKNIEDTLLIK